MKTPIEISIKANNLLYIGIGEMCATVQTETSDHDGHRLTEHFITDENLILDEVTIYPADSDIAFYEGKALPRHDNFFEKQVKKIEIDYERNINLEVEL